MQNIDDVINWFRNNDFKLNALVTIITQGGRYEGLRILAILIFNKKAFGLFGYNSKSSFISYLRD